MQSLKCLAYHLARIMNILNHKCIVLLGNVNSIVTAIVDHFQAPSRARLFSLEESRSGNLEVVNCEEMALSF